jgi:hypothetical protein
MMRSPLNRHYGQGDLHFITFSCYRRRPLLGTARARDQFVKILEEVRRRAGGPGADWIFADRIMVRVYP